MRGSTCCGAGTCMHQWWGRVCCPCLLPQACTTITSRILPSRIPVLVARERREERRGILFLFLFLSALYLPGKHHPHKELKHAHTKEQEEEKRSRKSQQQHSHMTQRQPLHESWEKYTRHETSQKTWCCLYLLFGFLGTRDEGENLGASDDLRYSCCHSLFSSRVCSFFVWNLLLLIPFWCLLPEAIMQQSLMTHATHKSSGKVWITQCLFPRLGNQSVWFDVTSSKNRAIVWAKQEHRSMWENVSMLSHFVGVFDLLLGREIGPLQPLSPRREGSREGETLRDISDRPEGK